MVMLLILLVLIIKVIRLNINIKQYVKQTTMAQKMLIPLKYLSNFWKAHEISLVSCEINLLLTWYEKCVITS